MGQYALAAVGTRSNSFPSHPHALQYSRYAVMCGGSLLRRERQPRQEFFFALSCAACTWVSVESRAPCIQPHARPWSGPTCSRVCRIHQIHRPRSRRQLWRGIQKCELGENQPRNETRVGRQLEAAKHKSRVTHPALLTQCGPNY